MLDRLLELIASGGFVMSPLIIGSGLLWFGLTQRIQFLRRGDSRNVRKLLREGFSSKSVFLNFLHRIEKVHTSQEGEVILSEAQDHFSKYNILTTTVVMIAPLLGLLGTVSGMIETFDSLGDMSLFSQSGGIAGGISQALVSTQMGLAVAIPGLVLGRILGRKQMNLMTDLQQACELKGSVNHA